MRIQILISGPSRGLIEPPVARWFKSIRTRTQRVVSFILTWSWDFFSELSGIRILLVPTYMSDNLCINFAGIVNFNLLISLFFLQWSCLCTPSWSVQFSLFHVVIPEGSLGYENVCWVCKFSAEQLFQAYFNPLTLKLCYKETVCHYNF